MSTPLSFDRTGAGSKLVIIVLALTLAGCASSNTTQTESQAPPAQVPYVAAVEISQGCNDAMVAVLRVPAGDPVDDALMPTLVACTTYEEWSGAIRQYPIILGVTDQITPTEATNAAMSLCEGASVSDAAFAGFPVCRDALDTGVMDPVAG